MAAIVTLRKLTSGTEVERLVAELREVVGVSVQDGGDGNVYLHYGGPGYPEAVADVEKALGSISDTWGVHLQVLPGKD